jgi:F0F1-type ATP synthase delta subunit
MLELIRGYASAAFDGAEREGHLDAVSAGLTELARVFVASEPLRTAFADGSIPAADRRAVLEDLLATKIPEEALAPVTFAVETERATELEAAGRGRRDRRRQRCCRRSARGRAAGRSYGRLRPHPRVR